MAPENKFSEVSFNKFWKTLWKDVICNFTNKQPPEKLLLKDNSCSTKNSSRRAPQWLFLWGYFRFLAPRINCYYLPSVYPRDCKALSISLLFLNHYVNGKLTIWSPGIFDKKSGCSITFYPATCIQNYLHGSWF